MIAPGERVLLIIPTYNEAGNIARLIREIQEQRLPLEILVIDDNSPDGTAKIAEELASEAPVRVLCRSGKLGIGSAHREGFRYAIEHGYLWAATMDADFSHSPEYLPALLAKADQGRIVVGSRYIPGGGLSGWEWYRRVLTHTAHWLTTNLLKIPYDCTGGFRLYPVPLLRELALEEVHSEGYAFLTELLFHVSRKGFRVVEIPIIINSRHKGKSKISRAEILRAVKTLCRLSLQRMMRNGGTR